MTQAHTEPRAPVHATAGDERGSAVAWLLERASRWRRVAEEARLVDRSIAYAAALACTDECVTIAAALASGAHDQHEESQT